MKELDFGMGKVLASPLRMNHDEAGNKARETQGDAH
jgi:hypothetical protein